MSYTYVLAFKMFYYFFIYNSIFPAKLKNLKRGHYFLFIISTYPVLSIMLLDGWKDG